MKNPEKQEVILYGGAFNPPTLAHQAILRACVEYARTRNAEVWVMPSGDRADKTISTSRELRMAYIATMLAAINTEGVKTDILTSELDRAVQVETYDTVVELEHRFPDKQIRWVFGADSTETMGGWDHGDWLLENLDIIAIERVGSAINPLAKHAITLATNAPPNLSSTLVRNRLAEGLEIEDLVGAEIAGLLK